MLAAEKTKRQETVTLTAPLLYSYCCSSLASIKGSRIEALCSRSHEELMSLLQIRRWVNIGKSQLCWFIKIFPVTLYTLHLLEIFGGLSARTKKDFHLICLFFLCMYCLTVGESTARQLLKPLFFRCNTHLFCSGLQTLPKISPDLYHIATDKKTGLLFIIQTFRTSAEFGEVRQHFVTL